jgi:hypothetical protein
MKRLIGFLAILFFALAPNCVAAGDMFSARCEGDIPARPYFATFDIDTRAVVFETPPLNAETS